jgi:hypothetical protein
MMRYVELDVHALYESPHNPRRHVDADLHDMRRLGAVRLYLLSDGYEWFCCTDAGRDAAMARSVMATPYGCPVPLNRDAVGAGFRRCLPASLDTTSGGQAGPMILTA